MELRKLLKTHYTNLVSPFRLQRIFSNPHLRQANCGFLKFLSLKNPIQSLHKRFLEVPLNLIAYPKINLCLYVGKKRSDGYHPIISVFQLVEDSVYKDTIKIKLCDSDKISIDVIGLDGFADKTDNTVYDAAFFYLDMAGITANVRIEIHKNIPSLAGLGGGSSDAGAVLRGLNSVYGKLSDDKLLEVALRVGSDVPFFVSGYKTAVAEGRGEILTPLETRNDLHFKLFSGTDTKVGTGYAYSQLDKRSVIPDLPSKDYLAEQYRKPVANWNFSNDFEILYDKVPNLFLTGSGTFRFTVSECPLK